MFNHVPVNLPEISAKTTDGVRLYETPEGNKYPSITTVLSTRNKKGLMEWRNKVGNEVANYVAGKAAARGTKVHHMCEDYLNNMEFNYPDKWEKHKKTFLPYCIFQQLKNQALCNIDNIHAQEAGLYSDKYKVAGRVDCVAEYNGKLSIIDFKGSTRQKREQDIENYYLQGTAYAIMWHERTKTPIHEFNIIVASENGAPCEVFSGNPVKYVPKLYRTIKNYHDANPALLV